MTTEVLIINLGDRGDKDIILMDSENSICPKPYIAPGCYVTRYLHGENSVTLKEGFGEALEADD